MWGFLLFSDIYDIDEDTLTSQIGRHFEIGENKPYLNIRIYKTNFFNSLFLLDNDNHSFEQKSGIQLVLIRYSAGPF